MCESVHGKMNEKKVCLNILVARKWEESQRQPTQQSTML